MARVEIYTRDFCGYCARAKALLSAKQVDFLEIRAGDDAAKRSEMIQRSKGGSTFPQIFINDRHIGGSDDMYELDRAGRLDSFLAEAPAPKLAREDNVVGKGRPA